jgi:ssDNA-binding Zn-finger/Zn-ribbon topoisomerase 1
MQIRNTTNESYGECPYCGGDLYLMRGGSGSRYIKCGDSECTFPKNTTSDESAIKFTPSFSYPIPRSGKVMKTGFICEKHKLPVLVISKGKPKNMVYFWVKGPCFVCPESHKCELLADLKEEF